MTLRAHLWLNRDTTFTRIACVRTMTTSLPAVPQFSPVPPVPSPAAGILAAGAPGEEVEVVQGGRDWQHPPTLGAGAAVTTDVPACALAVEGRGRVVGRDRKNATRVE
jgi:hypothetical protein